MQVQYRQATEADREWLYALDTATMADAPPPAARGAEGRRARFDRHFEPAQLAVIRSDGRDCGVLRLEERGGALYVAVLEIAPAHQGRGLGTAVLREVLARAAAERRVVALRVHRTNEGARRLYERLGFRVVGGTDTKLELRWRCAPGPTG